MTNKRLNILMMAILTLSGCAALDSKNNTLPLNPSTNPENNHKTLTSDNSAPLLESINHAIQANDQSASLYLTRAALYQQLNNPSAANLDIQQALKLAKNDPNQIASYANQLCVGQDYPDASNLFKQALANPNKLAAPSQVYTDQAYCRVANNKPQEALVSYNKALTYESAPFSAYTGISDIYMLENNYMMANLYVNQYGGPVVPELILLRIRILEGLTSHSKDITTKTQLIAMTQQQKNQLLLRFPNSNEAALVRNRQYQIPANETQKSANSTSKKAATKQPSAKNNASSAITDTTKTIVVIPSAQASTTASKVNFETKIPPIITTKTNNSSSLAAKKSLATLSSENPQADFYNAFASRIKTDANAHRYLIVKAGDTLYSLANKSLVSKEKLIQINNLKNSEVKMNSRIYLDN